LVKETLLLQHSLLCEVFIGVFWSYCMG
jgi:hypothetical protein